MILQTGTEDFACIIGCMFRIGDEVLCVDDDLHGELQDASSGLDGLKAGERYHIRSVGVDVARSVTRHTVRLVEIFREPLHGVGSGDEEAFYWAFRFKRPIAITKTTERKVPTKLEDA